VRRALLGRRERGALATLGGAAFLLGVLVACLAYLTPNSSGVEDDLNRERLQLMQQYFGRSRKDNASDPRANQRFSGQEERLLLRKRTAGNRRTDQSGRLKRSASPASRRSA
jgi:hypothetical protein